MNIIESLLKYGADSDIKGTCGLSSRLHPDSNTKIGSLIIKYEVLIKEPVV
jgi:hypothetical protein